MYVNASRYLSACGFIACCSILASCGSNRPGCPLCTTDLQQAPVLPFPDNPFKAVQMKWVAVSGAPSISDPSLVCENNFKDVLFRRHIRASGCIWTPQCRIIITSVFGPEPTYGIIGDTDLSVGESGDVAINENSSFTDEMIDLANAADAHWNTQPTGITAIAIRRFIWPDGTPSGVKGVGFHNSGTRPVLFVNDPAFLPDILHEEHVNTERVLAHEIGHTLGLCHPGEGGCDQVDANQQAHNLMMSNGSTARDRTLTANQCQIARDTYPHLFTNAKEFVLMSSVLDTPSAHRYAKNMRYLDLQKILVTDGSPRKGNLKFLLGTNGLFQKKAATYWLGLDIDNMESTGLSVVGLIPNGTQSGVELVVKVTIDENKQAQAEIFKTSKTSFVAMSDHEKFLKAQLNTVMAYVYSDDDHPPKLIPVFEELEMEISAEAFQTLGLPVKGKPAFPNGFRMQALSYGLSGDGGIVSDSLPDAPELLQFKK